MTPGVSTISIVTAFPFSSDIVTPSFLLARLVSCGISLTGPTASPVQSLTILFESVVFPAFGGPYIPILICFFLNRPLKSLENFCLVRTRKLIYSNSSKYPVLCTINIVHYILIIMFLFEIYFLFVE